MDDFDHNKMNSIILETTAQVERKVRLDTILYAYGTEIIAVTILVLAALIGGYLCRHPSKEQNRLAE